MAIKIKNVGLGMRHMELEHAVLCGGGACSCRAEPSAKLNRDPATGKVTSYKIQPRRHAPVVTLEHGATSTFLPDRVVRCRDVVAQLAQKNIQVTHFTDAQEAAEKKKAEELKAKQEAEKQKVHEAKQAAAGEGV